MPGIESRNFGSPDETRSPDMMTVELVNSREARSAVTRSSRAGAGRSASSPSPRDTCQVEHIGYAVSGSLHVEHEDWTTGEVSPDDVYRIAPGHDAWVVGDEPAVLVEFQGAANYAKA
jgi:hypothetical protein